MLPLLTIPHDNVARNIGTNKNCDRKGHVYLNNPIHITVPGRRQNYAKRAATTATTPAPANVLSELAPPVLAAESPLEVLEEDAVDDEVADASDSEEEPEVLELALLLNVEIPVEVMVVKDPLVDKVEVMVEAVVEGRLEGW